MEKDKKDEILDAHIEEVVRKVIDELYGERKDLKRKFPAFNYKNYLEVAIDFLESYIKLIGLFPEVRGFMFDEGRVKFVIDDSAVDGDKKKKIREAFVGFVDRDPIIKKIKAKQEKNNVAQRTGD